MPRSPTVLVAPDPDAACRLVRRHVGSSLVQLIGACTIDYQGRAQSTLALGERIVLVKPDGALLVHSGHGVKPVNWQPSGTTVTAAARTRAGESVLVLTGERSQPKEIVTIVFEVVHLVLAAPLRDWEDLQLVGSEADIAQLLAMHPHLIEEGFEPQAMELERRRGPMDIYGTDARGQRVVVEVKRRAAGLKDATQLARYVERERDTHKFVRGILVAPGASAKALKYLHDKGLEHRELDLGKLFPRLPQLAATQRTLSLFGADGKKEP